MPIGADYEDACLDALVASFPAGHYRLYWDLPTEAGSELAATGGYAPVAHASTDWAAAAGGVVSTSAPVSFGTSTDAWSDVAGYWAITDSLGALVYWDLLTEEIAVSAAGTAVEFTPSVFFRAES